MLIALTSMIACARRCLMVLTALSQVYGPEDAESLKHFVLQRAGSDGGFAGK